MSNSPAIMDIEAIKAAANPPSVAPRETLVERVGQCHVTFSSPGGGVHEGSFTYEPPTLSQRAEISRIFAALTGGVPTSQLPVGDGNRFYAFAYLAVTLKTKPDWWDHWSQQHMGLLVQVFEEVLQHEQRYFLGDRDAEEGEGGMDEPTVVVRSGGAPSA